MKTLKGPSTPGKRINDSRPLCPPLGEERVCRYSFIRFLFVDGCILLLLLSACLPSQPSAGAAPLPGVSSALPIGNAPSLTAGGSITAPPSATPLPSSTPQPSPTLTETLTPPPGATAAPTLADTATSTPDLRLPPERWQEWPVIPTLSARAQQILRDGVARGNNPRAFAKVGDCETITDWFLVDFDKGARFYDLGPYADLQPVIDYFAGSFQRKSAASMRGFTAAGALSPMWADPTVCQSGETPLGCEYRLQKPVVAFIMLGTNDVNHKATFEANLRSLLEATLAQDILPIMATKADDLEGDNALNQTMARLAYEYDLPLWNFWAAVQPLPNHGLVEDNAHLTHAPNFFATPDTLQMAWPVRNLTALQVLQVIMDAEK